MSQSRTRQFKQLQEHWYEKLKKEGFKDIEDTNSKNEFLKVWHSRYFSGFDNEASQAKKDYYVHASSFLEDHQFESKKEKRVWELHCDGLSVREIARKMKRISKSGAFNIVAALKKKMFEGR